MRKRLREGLLADREIEIEVAEAKPSMEIMGPAGMEEMTEQLRGMFANLGGVKKKSRKMKVAEAQKILIDEEAAKLVNDDDVKASALANAEQNGIVFIDEIDKVTSRSETQGADVSRQGVQRDLCRWSRERRSTPSTGWSRPTTSCSSPRARSTSPSRAT
jgi:ATP-dependent HslUV protease ATP-binding subunit HslU